MPTLEQATPFLLVPDYAAARDFFTRILGFAVPFEIANYLFLRRDGAAIRLLAERTAPVAPLEHARCTVYVDVDDVDALYAELKPRLETLPAADWSPPVDQAWNQRELSVRMPDGHWLAFGHPVRR